MTAVRPDVVLVVTDQERAPVPYESDELTEWRQRALPSRRWFDEHGVSFRRHYTGSLACVPSRPTIFTGQFPDVHGVAQTDGFGKRFDDPAMRWLQPGEVPTLGHWFRAAGYDTRYEGKWHISHANLHDEHGESLATNDDDGVIDPAAEQRYLDADPLDEFGFSGWIGPEPHGPLLANSGFRRDPIFADRAAAWLDDRYRRRAEGDADALRPFLLVVSFVNPHDIVFFPGWTRNSPIGAFDGGDPDLAPPATDPPPTATESLDDRPSQAAYRDAYPSAYAPIANGVYDELDGDYRTLYHHLHRMVDEPIGKVIDAVTASAEHPTVMVRTADHGELLGAHGGLHQKWYNLFEEAIRVPFVVARLNDRPTTARTVERPTSHADLVPTMLGLAGIDRAAVAAELEPRFSEFHPLPGHDLSPIVDDPSTTVAERAVYVMTRDRILEGDTKGSAVATALGIDDPPPEMLIQVPTGVGTNFEAVVVDDADGIWKLVRCFDDAAEPLADVYELYRLDTDPAETKNLAADPAMTTTKQRLIERLEQERARQVPARHRSSR